MNQQEYTNVHSELIRLLEKRQACFKAVEDDGGKLSEYYDSRFDELKLIIELLEHARDMKYSLLVDDLYNGAPKP